MGKPHAAQFFADIGNIGFTAEDRADLTPRPDHVDEIDLLPVYAGEHAVVPGDPEPVHEVDRRRDPRHKAQFDFRPVSENLGKPFRTGKIPDVPGQQNRDLPIFRMRINIIRNVFFDISFVKRFACRIRFQHPLCPDQDVALFDGPDCLARHHLFASRPDPHQPDGF